MDEFVRRWSEEEDAKEKGRKHQQTTLGALTVNQKEHLQVPVLILGKMKMPLISRKRLSRTGANRTLRNLVRALAEVGTPRERSVSELASEMSKRISQSKPSTFNSKGNPSELELWLREFDKIFDVVECPEELKVNHAAFYLVGEADYW